MLLRSEERGAEPPLKEAGIVTTPIIESEGGSGLGRKEAGVTELEGQ